VGARQNGCRRAHVRAKRAWCDRARRASEGGRCAAL
jgi:hypothetical protein